MVLGLHLSNPDFLLTGVGAMGRGPGSIDAWGAGDLATCGHPGFKMRVWVGPG